jgi:hypothetical protein
VRELLEDPRYVMQYEESREQAMYQAEIDEIEKIQASLQNLLSTEPATVAPDTPVLDTEDEHPSLENLSQEARLAHIQDMLMEGYSNDEILALHPELTLQDIIDAGAAAAASN